MSKKILVVEDDATMRETLSALLRREGFEVVTACDGLEGFTQAQIHTPDLVITDLNMPLLDGVALARKLRDETALARSPILALSANLSDYNLPERMNSGITRFYDKAGHDGPSLLSTVHNLLESAPPSVGFA
jgi:CheY-like chemotaxis protein